MATAIRKELGENARAFHELMLTDRRAGVLTLDIVDRIHEVRRPKQDLGGHQTSAAAPAPAVPSRSTASPATHRDPTPTRENPTPTRRDDPTTDVRRERARVTATPQSKRETLEPTSDPDPPTIPPIEPKQKPRPPGRDR